MVLLYKILVSQIVLNIIVLINVLSVLMDMKLVMKIVAKLDKFIWIKRVVLIKNLLLKIVWFLTLIKI